jgi:hypothetical protein
MAFAYSNTLRNQHPANWRAGLWSGAFAALGVGASLGAVAHGLELSARDKDRIWNTIYPGLASAVALFATGAISDYWGEATGRRMLAPALGSAALFALLVRHVPGGFLAFLGYEALAMLLALGIYADLARRNARPGAQHMVGGIGLSIAAAAVQASNLRLTVLGVPFDNNGIFHLIQMAGLPLIAAGLEAGFS